MSGDIFGGCLCGAVRYRIIGKADGTCHCHCDYCRKSTGSAMVTWTTVAKKDFDITQGELTLFASSNEGHRSFCSNCGSHITLEYDKYPDYVDVTVGTLDVPGKIPPERHIWASKQINWVKMDEHLPKVRVI